MRSRESLPAEVQPLAEAVRARVRAEFVEHRALLEHVDAAYAVIDADDDTVLGKQIQKTAVPLMVGRAMGLSEAQVIARHSTAARARERLPRVWVAFSSGDLDAARVREIVRASERLDRDASIMRLDQRAVEYAPGHTVAELRGWLRRFVIRTEPDLAADRAETEKTDRRVSVEHGDDGMSWLTAYLPSDAAAAIAYRLSKTARAMDGDPRTQAQRQADLLIAWATRGIVDDETVPNVRVDIAVTIGADVLAGATDGWGISADGTWAVPAPWVAELAQTADPFWHRMVLDPVTGDILAHDYAGRYAPEILAKVLAFRDGVCRAPGCLKPAHDCDLDHRQPWPDGTTSGDNLWALCRRHHTLKGHGVLQWVLPDGQTSDAEPADHLPPSPASGMEHTLAQLLASRVGMG